MSEVNQRLRQSSRTSGKNLPLQHIQPLPALINDCDACSNTVDDEEEMLYGESSAANVREEINRSTAAPMTSGSEGGTIKAEPTHWCVIIRENGVMEVQYLLCVLEVRGQGTCLDLITSFSCLSLALFV